MSLLQHCLPSLVVLHVLGEVWLIWVKKPNDKQDQLLREHTDLLKKHAELLDKDSRRLTELEEQDRLVMQALFALLSHGIDGNDIDAMRSVKAQIQKYLISK